MANEKHALILDFGGTGRRLPPSPRAEQKKWGRGGGRGPKVCAQATEKTEA